MTKYRYSYGVREVGGRSILLHILKAEEVLKRRLNKGECVHHVDNNGWNNSNSNLVICPSEGYHKLLHMRTEALEATGNANSKKCRYCKEWDDPKNLKSYERKDAHTPRYYHTVCHRKMSAANRAKKGN